MKKTIVITAVILLIAISVFAENNIIERNKFWMSDSYEFGKDGNNCNDILYNYGTPNWTFSSDDPDLLGLLVNACKAGISDKETGQNSLPGLLNKLDK